MKNFKLYSIIVASLFVFSCVDETDEYNENHDGIYVTSTESLLSNAQKDLLDHLTTHSVNTNIFRYLTQYYAATLYRSESRYILRPSYSNDNWAILYTDVLSDLTTAYNQVDTEIKPGAMSDADFSKQQTNKKAIIEILRIATYQVLVDTFGDIPYTYALDPFNPTPKYDDDTAIYNSLITRLNTAIGNLDTSANSFTSGDYIYNGNVSKWKKLANSLKVKLGINISDVNPTLAKNTIETAFNAGVITTNADNAAFVYAPSAPNYNPLHEELVASQRNDFVPTTVIIDQMNSLADPRRAVYFTSINNDGVTYVGGNYGFTNTQPYSSSYSHIGDKIKERTAAGLLIDATEINFYLAEAAAKGFSVGNTVEQYYNNAITSSFEYWGLSSQVATYLANPMVAYTTATGNYKEKIGNQAWLAFYNRGFESWNSYRRLDFPALVAPTSATSAADGKVPVRIPYPINEQTLNATNLNAASTAIGGDEFTTKIFWDVN